MNAIGLFFLFLISFIVVSVSGFLCCKHIHPDLWENHLTHESVGISGSILDVLAIFVSIPLSFILIFLWGEYNKLLNRIKHVVQELIDIKQQLIDNHINTVHFEKYLKTACVDDFNHFKTELSQAAALRLKQLSKQVNTLNVHFDFSCQVSQEIWSVIIVGVIVVILGTWLVKSPFWLHLYLIISVAAILGTLVFLIYFYDQALTSCHQMQMDLFKQI